jgi:hypothetical protein
MSFSPAKRTTSRSLLRSLAKVCGPGLRVGVAATNADHYVKTYSSTGFALAMVGYYILGLSAMRELHTRLKHDRHFQRVVGWSKVISVAQLLRLPHDRPADLWRPLIADLLQRLPRKHRGGKLRILDTSFFAMGLKLMQRHHPNKKMTHPATAGFKFGAVLDPESGAPVHFISSVGQGTDTAHVDALVPPDKDITGHVFLFDRGFRKYRFFDRLIDGGAHFITRATARVRYEVVRTQALDPNRPEVLCDEVVRLGSHNAHNLMHNLVRRIVLDAQGEILVFITSYLDQPAWGICEDYRQRWTIEPFFRWFKSGIGCERPVGYSQTAAEHTFWAAIVAYILVLILAESAISPTTGRKTFRIKDAVHRIRATIYQPPSEADLRALGFS